MPARKKGKKGLSKSRATQTSANLSRQKSRQKFIDDPTPTSAPSRSLRSGLRSSLRSRPSSDINPPFEDNPESLLRKHRRSRKPTVPEQAEDIPQQISRTTPDILSKDVHSLLAEEYPQGDTRASDDSFANDSASSSQDEDPEQRFNRSWGYLPPLDEEAVAVIEAIMVDPKEAKRFKRISPEHKKFPMGLEDRNVSSDESKDVDSQLDFISRLAPGELVESAAEKESHGQLWASDQSKCNKGSKEALFQRTLMMSLIARHRTIYARDSFSSCLLDFSVEEPWSCPPMPTRAYWKGEAFLTQPKPDLAICFDRKALIPDSLWSYMPSATKRLACYEGTDETESAKVFHFFTIEAKKAKVATSDTVGRRQSLNNASQALHNMFEFFREAGPQHEELFFDKVRFFSVVASTEGVVVRIHRATLEPPDGSGQGFIIPDYPLRFEYREFCSIPRDKFERKTVLEVFEKILFGYGAGELHGLLQKAAEAVVEKLRDDWVGTYRRGNDEDFYRHGQTEIAPSKRTTPATSRAQSVQNDMSVQSGPLLSAPSSAQQGTTVSFDMARTGISTPGEGGSQATSLAVNDGGKRPTESTPSGRGKRPKSGS